MNPDKFTIVRSEWLRGESGFNSYLLRETDNKMCCLGFYSLACGYSSKEISNVHEPNTQTGNKYPLNFAMNDYLINCLMRDNDSTFLDDKKREESIIHYFKKIGVTVTFED